MLSRNVRMSITAAMFLTSACVHTNYSPTSDLELEAKPEDCDFKVVATMPRGDHYQEVGIVTVVPGAHAPFSERRTPETIEQFKNMVRTEVCEAGGDLVIITGINGLGQYVSGLVLRDKRGLY